MPKPDRIDAAIEAIAVRSLGFARTLRVIHNPLPSTQLKC